MKPLIVTSIGRAIAALDALAAREDVEVRRVPLLPTAGSLDGERPTVVLLDRALVQSGGDAEAGLAQLAEQAALVGVGEPGESGTHGGPPRRAPVGIHRAGDVRRARLA